MVKKARKVVKNENQLQLPFDFIFNETMDTIVRLQSEIDIDGGLNDVRREKTGAINSSEGSQTGNNQSDATISFVSSSGMEDSRPLGIQQSGRSDKTGRTRRSDPAWKVVRAADVRTQYTEQNVGTATEWSDGTRNFGNERNQYRAVNPSDYRIRKIDQLGEGGAKAKYRDNISALKLLIKLREERRPATQDEQSILVRYVGWGGLPQAFDHRNEQWQNEYIELSDLLSKKEYEQARRSTQDAHYTSQTVIEGIYKGLRRIGFSGGRVLEPSLGIGNFIGLMPQSMRETSYFTGIELDQITYEIAHHLYPKSTLINKGLQDVVIPAGYFDACVGNPPFGSQPLYDPNHNELSTFSIHNYFIAKSLDKLREGGVMAIVVSRYFMDAENSKARGYIADQARFLGAIRLPSTAFKRNALTEVTTDIVFFQKIDAGENRDRSWVDIGEIKDHETGEAIAINRYFIENPEQMLGRMAITNKMHRATADLVSDLDIDLDSAIEQGIYALPEGIYRPVSQFNESDKNDEDKPTITLPDTLKVGSFFIAPNGRLACRLPDILDKQDYTYVDPKNVRMAERITGMIKIRSALRDLIQSEQSGDDPDLGLESQRLYLNHVYDKFVRKFGYISSQVNRLAMSEDPEYPLLHSLESDYDRGISPETSRKQGVKARSPSAKKAAIFYKRVMSFNEEVKHVETAKDALVVSMNEIGRIDIDRMVRLSGQSEKKLVNDLKGLMFFNPGLERWEIADQYLSGNVKEKLRIAEKSAEKNQRYIENINALRTVLPIDIEPIDISIQLGSTWVPGQVVSQFVGHLLGDVHRSITYVEELGKWIVDINRCDHTTNCVTWGIETYPANKLIEYILINKPIKVHVEDKDENGNKISRLDDVQTAAANQKADEIRQAFLDWVWEDKDRRESLAKIYNDRFNTNIPTKYDGSHLDLSGSSLSITLRPHQKDAIWRGIQDGTALFDHVVGAGKTLVCVGTIMESKRMGLMTKPMLVVPNHLLLQWKDAFYALYPNANILVADKSDFKKENRERLFGRIVTGNWDAVIVAHSSFKKIGMPEDTLKLLLEEQIEDLSNAITILRNERGDRITIKEMEKAKDRMTARLKVKANNKNKDQAVSFADLGVDSLFVDEAHEFKNLYITTSLSRISGLGNLSGSEKAFDLFVKCRYLQQRYDGRGVFFATGTPISNTIAELYTMQRYLQYDELKSRGILHFDAWASTFGQVVTGWELDATGVNYRLNSRFSKFQNVPELMSLYRTFADVITTADLERQAEERGTRFPVPKVKHGGPKNIIVDRSEDQARFMGIQSNVLDSGGNPMLRPDGSAIKAWNEGSIIYRMENLPRDPRIDNPLKITNDARKAGLDFRLVDPNSFDDPNSKVNTAIDNIYRIWDEWKDRKGTQLVFCDLSTPKLVKQKSASSVSSETDNEDDNELSAISMDELLAQSTAFSVYDDIKEKLVRRGVPEHEIRFIHEASTDLKKSRLFDDMNLGHSRIMLGSTAKMGAGTNVQRRLVALHHLDAPWRPSDLEQREGRILRQGNLFYEENPDGFEIEILRYATRQTYDSRMWQTIEHKATGIEQFRKGDNLLRVIEDIASEAANAAEMKAAATGNPLIFLQVRLSAELKKIEALFSNYKRNQYALQSRVAWLADADRRASSIVSRWNKEINLRDTANPEEFHTKTQVFGEKDRRGLLGEVLNAMKKAVGRRSVSLLDTHAAISIGTYRGFHVEVYAHHDQIQFTLTGEDSHEPENLRYRAEEKFSITGFLNRMDNFMACFEEFKIVAKETRDRERREFTHALAEKDKGFPHQHRLETLRQDVRDVIKELQLMQSDGAHVSQWKPKSFEMNDLNHEKIKITSSDTKPRYSKYVESNAISTLNLK